jgi:3-isopropylmalate dehydrogenase
MIPSASLGDDNFGVYEPIHGSAPDIQGKGLANPCGMILSVAMLLKHSLNLNKESNEIEDAIESVLDEGIFTADLCSDSYVSTDEMGKEILSRII